MVAPSLRAPHEGYRIQQEKGVIRQVEGGIVARYCCKAYELAVARQMKRVCK